MGQPTSEKQNKCIALNLSMLKVLTATLVFLFGMTGVFILGVMAGRSAASKKTVSLPPPVTVAARQNAKEEEISGDDILHAKDLRYQSTLKKKGLTDSSFPDPKPQEVKLYTPPKPVEEAQKPADSGKPVTQEAPDAPKSYIRYDYVYQLATFDASEERKIDSLRESLESEGFRSRVKRSGNKRAVQLVIRGTETVEEDVARLARRLKLGSPWLRSKTQVR